MDTTSVPLLAGIASTAIFAGIFYLTSSAAMLLGFLRFESRRSTQGTIYATSKSRLGTRADHSLSDR